MGNTLTLKCPSCGLRTEQRVTKTSPTHWHTPSQKRQSFGFGEYRERERQCGSCGHKFATIEMERDVFYATINTLTAMQRSLGELVASNEVNALVARCTPIMIMIDAVFGGEIDPSQLGRLSVSQLREIVEAAKGALRLLEPDERNCMVDFFGLYSIEGFEKDPAAPVNADTTLEKLLRKMKHPSRSRLLRRVYDLVSERDVVPAAIRG
jgi:hypothetical protein